MRIDPKEVVSGVRVLHIRDYLYHYRSKGFSFPINRLFDALEPQSDSELLKWLQEKEYIKRVPEDDEPEEEYWEVTQPGRDFTVASANKPLKRETAQRLIREFLKRCRALDRPESSIFPFTVKEVLLFGSYLDEKRETINDIDIAVTLSPRYSKEEQVEAEDDYIKWHGPERTLGIFEVATYAKDATYKYLKAKNGYFHFVPRRDTIFQKDFPRKIIYANGDLTIEVPKRYKSEDSINGYRLGYGDGLDGAFSIPTDELVEKLEPLTKLNLDEARVYITTSNYKPKLKAYLMGILDAGLACTKK